MVSAPAQLTIVTCSYAPDFHRCERLCKTVNQYAGEHIDHLLLVPARDAARFNALATPRRRVIDVESLVPGNFRQLPFSNKWWLHNGYWPVRGWVMQQITKLSASYGTDAELLLYADSDLQFIRPFGTEHFIRESEAGPLFRFFADEGKMDFGEHLHWHHVASKLLGLPAAYAGANYNGQLITWRRSDLVGLHKAIEQQSGNSWSHAIARCRTVSEYILYGNYIDRVAQNPEDRYLRSHAPLVASCWTREQLDAFLSDDTPFDHNLIAMHLQSNLGLSEQEENTLLRERLAVKVQ